MRAALFFGADVLSALEGTHMKNTTLRAAGILFLIVALMHMARMIFRIEVLVAGVRVPLMLSAAGFIATLALALWMFAAANR